MRVWLSESSKKQNAIRQAGWRFFVVAGETPALLTAYSEPIRIP